MHGVILGVALGVFGGLQGALADDPCPEDMVAVLESHELTSVQKKAVVERCGDRVYPLEGVVLDVDSRSIVPGEMIYEVRLKAPEREGELLAKIYEVTLAEDHGCGDLVRISKGMPLRMEVRFNRFGGFLNEWATAVDGRCLD